MCVCMRLLHSLLLSPTKSRKDVGQTNQREFIASLVESLKAIKTRQKKESKVTRSPSAAFRESRKPRRGGTKSRGRALGPLPVVKLPL